MTTSAPIDLRLRVGPGPTLVAELHNTSSAPVSVVVSTLQPLEVTLTGPSGAVTPFDMRTVAKYDMTVREGSFTTVAPGASAAVATGKLNGGALQMGPLRFESLAPGSYRAKVTLHSKLTEYSGPGGSTVKKADAWAGTATSNEVTFQVQ